MKVTRITGSQLFIVIILLALIILDKGCIPQLSSSIPSTHRAAKGFVTRSGSQLMLNGHPFRFAGANMHWLPFGDSTTYTPQFEINDGLDAAKEMGITVVRSDDLGISTGCRNCIEPTLGVFNQT